MVLMMWDERSSTLQWIFSDIEPVIKKTRHEGRGRERGKVKSDGGGGKEKRGLGLRSPVDSGRYLSTPPGKKLVWESKRKKVQKG